MEGLFMPLAIPSSDEIRSIIREELELKFSQFDSLSQNTKQSQNIEVDEPFLSQSELSELLKISKVSIIKWQKEGLLKVHRIGRRVLYKKSEILSALNKRSVR